MKFMLRDYFCVDSHWVVAAKTIKNVYHTVGAALNWKSHLSDVIIDKVIPSVAKWFGDFPDPPEEMKEAVVMKNKQILSGEDTP